MVRVSFPLFVLLYIDLKHWRRLSIYIAPYLFLFLFVYHQEVSFQFGFLRKVSVNTSNKLGGSLHHIFTSKYLSKTRYLRVFNQILQGGYRNGRLLNIYFLLILSKERQTINEPSYPKWKTYQPIYRVNKLVTSFPS